MNNINCEIVKDLLPLYADNICSEYTKAVIEEHLSLCENCREAYDAMHEDFPEETTPELKPDLQDDIAFMRKVKKRLAKHQFIPLVIVLPVFILLLAFMPAILASFSAIPAEDIHVTELYELENGDIYCTIESDMAITSLVGGYTNADELSGKSDVVNYNGIIKASSPSLLHRLTNMLTSQNPVTVRTQSFIFTRDRAEADYGGAKFGTDKAPHCLSISYIGRQKEELSIWEEGQKLETAPEEIEKKLKKSEVSPPSIPVEQPKLGDILIVH